MSHELWSRGPWQCFFRDPDGHLLEYIAMLPQQPRPEYGIIPWRVWEHMHHAISFKA